MIRRSASVVGLLFCGLVAVSCGSSPANQPTGSTLPDAVDETAVNRVGSDSYCEVIAEYSEATIELYDSYPEGEAIDGHLVDELDVEYLPRVVATSPEEFRQAWEDWLEIKQTYVDVHHGLAPESEASEATTRKAAVLEALEGAIDSCQ